jgi:ribosomal silencing factor RsfS
MGRKVIHTAKYADYLVLLAAQETVHTESLTDYIKLQYAMEGTRICKM